MAIVDRLVSEIILHETRRHSGGGNGAGVGALMDDFQQQRIVLCLLCSPIVRQWIQFTVAGVV